MMRSPFRPFLYDHFFDRQAIFSFSEDVFDLPLHAMIPDNSLLWHDPAEGKLDFMVPNSHPLFHEIKRRLEKAATQFQINEAGLNFGVFFPQFENKDFLATVKATPTALVPGLVVFPALVYRDRRVYLLEMFKKSSMEASSDRIMGVSEAYSTFTNRDSLRIEYLGPVLDFSEFYQSIESICITLLFKHSLNDEISRGPKWPILQTDEVTGEGRVESMEGESLFLMHQYSVLPDVKLLWMESYLVDNNLITNIIINKQRLPEVLSYIAKLESRPSIIRLLELSQA